MREHKRNPGFFACGSTSVTDTGQVLTSWKNIYGKPVAKAVMTGFEHYHHNGGYETAY